MNDNDALGLWLTHNASEPYVPSREEWRVALCVYAERLKAEKRHPYPFVGLSGVGFVCPAEASDIANRTGPYRRGGPLDLGDSWYSSEHK